MVNFGRFVFGSHARAPCLPLGIKPTKTYEHISDLLPYVTQETVEKIAIVPLVAVLLFVAGISLPYQRYLDPKCRLA